ncbi:hypothetical protein C4J96_1543 [Pseudomonas orientalis]|uniref:hypothetical protein n=1 Tax=Pseudomonas orientalis TaxID=76758 RepID=UPI000F563193|nr:hypothetical protein [Pseudomonas orientalis]AZE93675.1 hypothetical protein C4J96_1543 [Pseudomonas orientalis]
MFDPEWLKVPLPKTLLIFLLVEIVGGILAYYFLPVVWLQLKGRTSVAIFQNRVGRFLLRMASFYLFRFFALWVMMYAFLNLLEVLVGIASSSYLYFYVSDFLNGHVAIFCFVVSLVIVVLVGPKGMVVPITPDLTVSMDSVDGMSFHIRSLTPEVDIELYSREVSKAIKMFDGLGVESRYLCVSWLFVPNQKRKNEAVISLRDEFRAVPSWLRKVIKFLPGATYGVGVARAYAFAEPICLKQRLFSRAYTVVRCIFIFSSYIVFFRFVRVWLLIRDVPILDKVSQSGLYSAKAISSETVRCYKQVLPNRMRVMTFLTLSMRMPHLMSQIGGLEAGYLIKKKCKFYQSGKPVCGLSS